MEQKQDSDGDLGVFVLRMNLSSDSEADLEEEREDKRVVGPKNEPIDEAEVLGQHEPRNDNCTRGSSTKAVAKRRSYKKKRVKWGSRDEIVMCSAVVDGIKCGLQGVRSAADAIHVKRSEGFWDEVNKKLKQETGKCVSRGKLYYKFRDTRRRFLDNKRSPNPQLNQHDKEVFRILAQAFENSKGKKRGLSDAIHSDAKGDTAEIDSLLEGKLRFPEKKSAKCMSKFHSYHHCTSCSPGSRKQDDEITLNKSSSILRTPRKQDVETRLKNSGGYGRGMYQNKELSAKKSSVHIDVVKEQNADIGSNSKGEVGLDSSTFGSSGKRLKWNLRDDIVIASVVSDSVNCRLHGVNSAKEVTRFKTHKGFWDEVAERLKEETGKCVSPWKFCTKFRSMKIRYLVQKQNHVQQHNKHDKELFGILDQMFGNVRKQRSHNHGSFNADVKGEISGGTIFAKRKSLKPLTTAHSSHLSTGSDLRNQNKRKEPDVNWNERSFLSERTPKQDKGTCLKNNGGDGRTMSHNEEFSAKKYSENSKEGKDAHLGSNRKEEVGLDSLTTGSSVKRLKWDLKDEIVIASFVRDGVNCGLDGVSSATDATHFKSHKGFWDEVAEKLNKETGQCASALKLFTKFRCIKNKYFVGKKSHVQQLNQHDKELFGILEQMYGNDGKQISGHHGSPGSSVKGEVSGGATLLVDTVLSTQRKSLEPLTAAYSSHPSTGPDLRNLNEVRPVLNWNERFPGDKTPIQEGGKDCFKNGGHGVLLSTCLSAVRSPANDGKGAEGQNEDQKSERKANVDNLVLRSGVKTVKRRVKRVKWGLRDEIVIASTVQDGINRGVHGVTSLRDAMSLCKHEGFWTEMTRKLKEEIGHYISTDKLFQKFRNMKYKYLNIKQSDIQEFNKHDKELFSVLEQVFGNGSCVTPHSDIKRLDISGVQTFSGNESQEKLYKQNRVSATEDEPQLEHEKAIYQDSQTCNQLPFEVLSTDRTSMGAQVKQRKEVESCPNVVHASTMPVPSLSPGNPSLCEGYQTGVTFSASTDHGVENHDGVKNKEDTGGKNKQLHDRIIMLLNETEVDDEQRPQDMLSKSESKSGERKGDQLVTDDILTGSRILEDPSDHQSDYAEVVKRLERKSRKLQLMQELYKIEQQEIEEHICQVKLKASSNP
jgi:hypothetical protein